MQRDGQTARVTLMEVVALKNTSNRKVADELEQVFHLQIENPLRVIAKRGFLWIKNLERLVNVGLRIHRNLLARKLRTSGIAARGIADKGGTVANDERDMMAQILELTELAQRNGMTKMNIGRRRVNAKFDIQSRATLEFFEQQVLRNDSVGTGLNDVELFFGSYRTHPLRLSRILKEANTLVLASCEFWWSLGGSNP